MYDILFTGDTFLNTKMLPRGGEFFTLSIEKLFTCCNNICINLETTIGTGGVKVPKAFNFQAPPEALRELSKNGIKICSLANNHSLDYGQEGLIVTKDILKQNDFTFIGTNESNRADLEVNGKRICVSSYYGNQDGLAKLHTEEIKKEIQHIKKSVDYLIVCLHWGEEYVAYPSPEQQIIAHNLIDSGANVVIGHHPHVIQGFEHYKNGLIFYSLGNFNFFVDHPYAKELVETTKAYCVGLNFNATGKVGYDIIPVHINENWQPEIINETNEKERFFRYLKNISTPLSTSKGIGKYFYLAEVSPHFFHNHLYSWKKRINNYGGKQLVQMVKWLLHPATYKY